MKQNIIKTLCMTFGFIASMNATAQQTSLTIDNQTPGWLSSKINYSDQLSVERLKVIGYINGTDINFLVQLQNDQKLRSLDLSDVNIVKGGDKVANKVNITEDNFFYSYLFLPFNNLQKLSTPKALKPDPTEHVCVNADTVILNCQSNRIGVYRSFRSMSNSGLPSYKIKVLEIAEGIDSVSIHGLHVTLGISSWSMEKLVLPSSLTKMADVIIEKGNIVSYIEHPENMSISGTTYNGSTTFQLVGDTIFIPQGTTERYKNSRFRNMKVFIEMIPTSIRINNNLSSVDNLPQLKIYRGDTYALLASTEPEEVLYKELKWESSDESIVVVNQNGEVSAMNPGTAMVTVSSVKNPDAKALCQVTVYEHTTGIEITSTEKEINLDETICINARTLPLENSDNEITWSSDDENIATVDEKGNVTGIGQGSCTITATTVDGGYTATCEVKVVPPVAVTGVTMDRSTLQFDYIGETANLKATVLPEDAANKNVKWTSSDESVCIVSNGMIVTVGMGTSVVIATTEDGGFMAVCVVTVTSATGLTSVKQNDGTMFQLYNINGLKRTQLQKGINIIRMSDGTTKKVLVK